LRLRDQLIPIAHLNSLLQLPSPDKPHQDRFVVMMQVGGRRFGIVVDQVVHTEEIVVKPMSSMLRGISVFSGNTILGDGSVIMILDPNGVSAEVGGHAESNIAPDAHAERAAEENLDASTSLLVFRAGSAEPKAVPISLVTRIEQIDAAQIERSNGRHMVQYRGSLMPLLPVNDDVRVRTEGSQPLLVFIDKNHSMGLIVDEIIDIVDSPLDIQVASKIPGTIGSAVIDGRATEIVDVAHYLPLAFEDWLHKSENPSDERTHRVVLVDDSSFFRNMLTPVLKAAGYEVKALASGAEALALLETDTRFDFVICDIEMPEMNGFEVARRLRADPRTAELRLVALSSLHSAAAIERGREAGFNHYIAKFDRGGLLQILKESHLNWMRAA
jgi:two-component system chemotaxis sensor kinase CheA